MRMRTARAFTLIELLTIIAIIAVLAAILFPAFAAVREQARQTNTMSNMHGIYVGARLFREDEGRYPTCLFGYPEIEYVDSGGVTRRRPVLPDDVTNTPDKIVPMDRVLGVYFTNADNVLKGMRGVHRGFLYREQVRDYNSFLSPDNLITDRKLVVKAYYPNTHPDPAKRNTEVTWVKAETGSPCSTTGDLDLPDSRYIGKPKYFYAMDSMDIGPMLDNNGKMLYDNYGGGKTLPHFELHYAVDWTHLQGYGCDTETPGGLPLVNQLKYRNPPAEQTVLCYSSAHVAWAGSPSVLVLLLTGTARKLDYKKANAQLPLHYVP